jgi:serine/threonine protein kinase
VDWWALGILIFEMLAGYPPFFDDNPFGIYEKILGGKIEWPRQIDPLAKDLIKGGEGLAGWLGIDQVWDVQYFSCVFIGNTSRDRINLFVQGLRVLGVKGTVS